MRPIRTRSLPLRWLCGLAFCLVALVAATLPAQTSDTSVREVAERIDARYNRMKSLRADFTEIYSGAGVQRDESGTLELKKPGKMLWNYTTPAKKIFVTDGKTAWFYVPGEQQARRTELKNLDDLRSPLRYLLGHTKLQKEFRGLSRAIDVTPLHAGDTVLRGVPKGMEDRVSEVLLESDAQGYLRTITIFELDGGKTEFQFTNQHENVTIRDAAFHFQPPPGVEVMRSENLQP